MSSISEFSVAVYSYTMQIPFGRITTYKAVAKAVAKAAGNEKAAEEVGRILSLNPYFPYVPCHRVVTNDGIFWRTYKHAMLFLNMACLKMRKLSKADIAKHMFVDFNPIADISLKSIESTMKIHEMSKIPGDVVGIKIYEAMKIIQQKTIDTIIFHKD